LWKQKIFPGYFHTTPPGFNIEKNPETLNFPKKIGDFNISPASTTTTKKYIYIIIPQTGKGRIK